MRGLRPILMNTPTTTGAGLLAEEPVPSSGPEGSQVGVTDWDEDVVAWCVALQAQPLDASRTTRTEALTNALVEACERGFVPYDTLTAVADAGAITPDVAVALLADRRFREEGESKPNPVFAAHEWLEDLAHENPGSGLNYATARAVLQLFPDLEGLRHALDASLRSNLPLPGTRDAVSSLRNALVLADLAGLEDTAALLSERMDPTLRGAWIDANSYEGREAGWTSHPEQALGVDGYETHLALDLLQRGGIPPGIDVNHLRMGMETRVFDIWPDPADHALAAMDAAFIDRTWPELVRPRFQSSDAVLVALLGLIAWAVIDILRLPLRPPEDGPRPAHPPG
jgi:hypothetical protein